MNFGEFLDGSGRIGRRDYIFWLIASILVVAIIAILTGVTDDLGDDSGNQLWSWLLVSIPWLIGLFLGIKRLHDFGKSGWLVLLGLVPIVQFFYHIALLVWPGDHGDNKYGSPNSGSPFPFLNR